MTNLERRKMLSEEDNRISRRDKRLAIKTAKAISSDWDTDSYDEDFFARDLSKK